MVVSMVASPVAGVVVERLGVRRCLAVGTPVLGLTWLMIAQATHYWVLLVARIIQGLLGEHRFPPPHMRGSFIRPDIDWYHQQQTNRTQS